MNDLHSRLSALADDLAPDADPYEQVAGARGLHRRQRRTRLGVAGAVAAVAALVVGVPAAVTTLSAPAGDVAAPGLPTASGPPTAPGDEEGRQVDRWTDELEQREREQAPLRPLAEELRAALSTEGVLTAPDAGRVAPCPDAAAFLGAAAGVPLVPGPEPATVDGCSWSTADGTREPGRLLLTLRNDPALTTEVLVRDVQSDSNEGGCYVTALPGSSSLTALVLCREGEQLAWRVTVLDDSGTGAWLLTAATGAALDEDTGARAVVALRDVLGGL